MNDSLAQAAVLIVIHGANLAIPKKKRAALHPTSTFDRINFSVLNSPYRPPLSFLFAERIAVGECVTDICAARAERHVVDGACGGTAGEPAGYEGQEKQFGFYGWLCCMPKSTPDPAGSEIYRMRDFEPVHALERRMRSMSLGGSHATDLLDTRRRDEHVHSLSVGCRCLGAR